MEDEAKENKLNRVDELIREIKVIRAVNSSLHTRVNSLESHIYSKDSEIKTLESKLEKASSKIHFLESEKVCLQKKYLTKIRNLENERRKNDIFNQKVMATSKTRRESFMIQEMDSLRAVNKTLLGIVDLLSEKIGFDGEIVKMVAEIADGVEDNILKLFVDSLKAKDVKSIDPEIVLSDITMQEKSMVKNHAEI